MSESAGSESAGSESVVPDVPWRRLEPASLLVNLLPSLWSTFRQVWPFLLALFFGRGAAQGAINIALIALFFGLGTARTVAHFLTLRYRFANDKLEIQSGVLSRQHRLLDPARIQNVEIVQNVFHRLFGLSELRIETANESGTEGLLSAITVEEAARLQALLRAHQPAHPADPSLDLVEPLGWLELVGYGVSAGRTGAAALTLGLAMDLSSRFAPGALPLAALRANPVTLMGLFLFAFAAAYLFSAGQAILQYAGYRLIRSPAGIVTEYGLLTRRRVEIPAQKVQFIAVIEPLLRRVMGYGSVNIETAAVGPQSGPAEAMIPMVAAEDYPRVLPLVLPALDIDPWATPLLPPARRALVRGLLMGLLRWAAIGAGVRFVLGSPWWMLLALVGPLLAVLDWQRQGWRLTPQLIVTRAGFLTRTTALIPRQKIQSIHLIQGPLLRWQGLALVSVWVAGARVSMPVMTLDTARQVFAQLTPAANTPPRSTR